MKIKLFIIVLFMILRYDAVSQSSDFKVKILMTDTSISFNVTNISKDTVFLLNSWSTSYKDYYGEQKILQIKSYPIYGGSIDHSVNLVKICPNNTLEVNITKTSINYNQLEKVNIIFEKISTGITKYTKLKQNYITSLQCQKIIEISNLEAIGLIGSQDTVYYSFSKVCKFEEQY